MSDLQITDLHKTLGAHRVLSGLELSVEAGSLTAILGRSGAGKTTLLRLIAGFEQPDWGMIRIGATLVDAEATHVRPEQRRIGYVPQEGGLFPHLTVAANIGFGLPRAQRRPRVSGLLDLVGLSGLDRRYPHQLSGGQQQRVALARALAVSPQLVLLDEPFASLDTHQRASVRQEVHAILRETQTTTLLVTHDQDEALSLADQIAVLRAGTIAQCATPEQLYTSPVDDGLARFVGDANLLPGTLNGTLVQTSLGVLPATWTRAPASSPCAVTVLIRPEQIELCPPDSGGLPGQIVRSNYHGHDTVLEIQITPQDGEHQLIVVRTLGHRPPQIGTTVTLTARGPVLTWPASSNGRWPAASSPPHDPP